jgi:tRNA nucleotidyltransferase (CCA-adding enzyme)
MKIKELLALIERVRKENNISPVWICGGVVRDRVLGTLKNGISDLDLTTGDATIHNLAREVELELKKTISVKTKKGDDGHSSIYIGNFKIDFSSNFETPGIVEILKRKGIDNPTSLQKEMFSRDYTCNALLMSIDLKTIKDPTGMGVSDIKNKILRTCLSPDITLKANTNRIIRAVYLSSKLGFEIEAKTKDFIIKNKNLVEISPKKYVEKNINKAFLFNKEKAISVIDELKLKDVLPLEARKYFSKAAQLKTNYDYGEGFYQNINEGKDYKSVMDFRKRRRNKRKKILKKIRDMKFK